MGYLYIGYLNVEYLNIEYLNVGYLNYYLFKLGYLLIWNLGYLNYYFFLIITYLDTDRCGGRGIRRWRRVLSQGSHWEPEVLLRSGRRLYRGQHKSR